MRPGKDFVGKPIYSITDGQHLGNVKDLLLDVELSSVTLAMDTVDLPVCFVVLDIRRFRRYSRRSTPK